MEKMHFMVTILVGVAAFLAGIWLRPMLWLGGEGQEAAAQPGQGTVTEVQVQRQELAVQELSAQELAAQGYLSMETLEIRIDDGVVQWYDGTVWHSAATVEELSREDKFFIAQGAFLEFEEQLKQQQEAGRAEQVSAGGQGETLLVGQKEEPKPTEKPKSTKPAVTAPATVPVSVPGTADTPENNGGGAPDGGSPGGGSGGSTGDGGSTGGGNTGGGNGGNSGGGNTGGDNPGGGDSGNTGGNDPGRGDSGNTGGDNPGGGDSGNTGGDNPGGGDSGDTGDGENMEWSDDYL